METVDWVTEPPLTAGQLVTELVALMRLGSPAVVVHSQSPGQPTTSSSLAETIDLATRFAVAARTAVVGVAGSVEAVDSYF
ncbi:MAG: hypothetical protein ABFS41_12705, partial [Myxococcota bacterium]